VFFKPKGIRLVLIASIRYVAFLGTTLKPQAMKALLVFPVWYWTYSALFFPENKRIQKSNTKPDAPLQTQDEYGSSNSQYKKRSRYRKNPQGTVSDKTVQKYQTEQRRI